GSAAPDPMKWLSTLILLVLAVVLFAFVFFWERRQPSTEEAAEKAKRLFTFDVKDLRWLEVDHDGTVARFERPAGKAPVAVAGAAPARAPSGGQPAEAESEGTNGWRMVRPIEDRADPYLLDGLARRVAELETTRTFQPGARLPSDADAGLQPPKFRI